jgi:hypothetical protein
LGAEPFHPRRQQGDCNNNEYAMSARGILEYAFNPQLAREIKQALVDAGFAQTVLLITATAPRLGLTPPWRGNERLSRLGL